MKVRVSVLLLILMAMCGQAAEKPNIILIMADDLGFSDLGSYGGEIETPNIDKLAANGLKFTQFYNTGRCCPTRASLMTGLYPHQAGIGHMIGTSPNKLYNGELSKKAVTIAEALKLGGYTTYLSGKWHLTAWPNAEDTEQSNWPNNRGFDQFYGTIASIRSYYNPPSLTRDGKMLPPPANKDFYYTEDISKTAVEFIEDHKSDKPFFLYVPHVAPHWPIQAPESAIDKYQERYEVGWDKLAEVRKKKMIELGLIDKKWKYPKRNAESLAWDEVKPEYKKWYARRMATFAAMVDIMDSGVGQIMDSLKKKNILENTIVIFLSDNGGCAEEIGPKGRAKNFPLETRDGRKIRLGNDPAIMPGPEDTYATYGQEWAGFSNTPFREFKSFNHEGGITTPLVIYWKGKVRQGLTHDLGHVIDILPTCLDLAGVDYPEIHKGNKIIPVEGKSLVKLFTDEQRKGHDAIYFEHEGNRAIRQGKWKLVRKYKDQWELFNMETDRLETKNLITKKPEIANELLKKYTAWTKKAGVQEWIGNQTGIGGKSHLWKKD
ncbi:MAG: arylsulfatase [Lentisphaeraceae bacterium]|nr:arylsulfatase [Lentisphaeraceae bacterium]